MRTQKLTIIDNLNSWSPTIEHPIIVTDDRVEKLYGQQLAKRLRCGLISVPAGEASKGIETYGEVIRKMARNTCSRKTTVIALGGGVVGDLAGFAAATFMRGIPCVQIPTTLLGMVDSAIGGKTGINLPEGKNLLGALHLPQETVIALDCLETLPDEQIRSGLSEVVKYGVILDAAFFSWLEENMTALLKKEREALKTAVARCAKLKVDVIERDPEELGLRLILNYGHTVGHALESLTRYEQYTHGEAIALGMCVEGSLAVDRTGFSKEELRRQNALLKQAHPQLSFPSIDSEALIHAMQRDKKSAFLEIVCVLPKKIGTMAQEKGKFRMLFTEEVIHETLHSYYSTDSC